VERDTGASGGRSLRSDFGGFWTEVVVTAAWAFTGSTSNITVEKDCRSVMMVRSMTASTTSASQAWRTTR